MYDTDNLFILIFVDSKKLNPKKIIIIHNHYNIMAVLGFYIFHLPRSVFSIYIP